MMTASLHAYLERLCNLLRVQVRASGAPFGLQPVQLEALRYVGACNRYSDNLQSVAEYLGQTKGTVSQTVKVLEGKGLLEKVADSGDRRLVHLRVTPRGAEVLDASLPPPALQTAAETLSPDEKERLRHGLEALLRAMQQANDLRTFGPCGTCRYNRRTPEGPLCGLTGERLEEPDLERICREHEYPSG